jgi:hypothetical protein
MKKYLITFFFLMLFFWGFHPIMGSEQKAKPQQSKKSTTSVKIADIRVPQVRFWETRYHNGVPWDTTSSRAALDAEVKVGAKILKYKDGSYVHTIHRQYLDTCGPASLAMVLEQLGVPRRHTNSYRPLYKPIDVDQTKILVEALPDRTGHPRLKKHQVHVGYYGSMEHIMWLGYHRKRLERGNRTWNNENPKFMNSNGILNVSEIKKPEDFIFGDKRHYLSEKTIPSWMWYGAAVGWGGETKYHIGLTGIMNYIFSGQGPSYPRIDAHPLKCYSKNDRDVIAIRRIIKGFIDHDISFLVGVESGGHINAGIGYHGSVTPASDPFYLYTADPLDGWGRTDNTKQPGRWRRMLVSKDNLYDGKRLIHMIVCWNHHTNGPVNGFKPSDWAIKVDEKNRNEWLLGYKPPRDDALKDPLTRKPRR